MPYINEYMALIMSPEEFAAEAISLFDAYKNSLGLKDPDELSRAIVYEGKFNSLICKYQGHEWAGYPRDRCARCSKSKPNQ